MAEWLGRCGLCFSGQDSICGEKEKRSGFRMNLEDFLPLLYHPQQVVHAFQAVMANRPEMPP